MELINIITQTILTSVSALMLQASIIQVAEIVPNVSLVSNEHIPATIISPPLTKDLSHIGELRHGSKDKALVALTFDDGLDPNASIQMLDTLREKHVHCTFFLKGNWITKETDLVKTIIADGHELGNHSFNHPDFTKISATRAKQEVQTQEDALVQKFHYSPKPYFRFPYGARTEKIISLIHQMGYTSVAWNIDTLDWKSSKEHILNEALTKAENGAIILMHLGKEETAKALPEIIDGLQEKGFSLVTISTLLEYDSNIPRSGSGANQ